MDMAKAKGGVCGEHAGWFMDHAKISARAPAPARTASLAPPLLDCSVLHCSTVCSTTVLGPPIHPPLGARLTLPLYDPPVLLLLPPALLHRLRSLSFAALLHRRRPPPHCPHALGTRLETSTPLTLRVSSCPAGLPRVARPSDTLHRTPRTRWPTKPGVPRYAAAAAACLCGTTQTDCCNQKLTFTTPPQSA